MQSYGMMQKRRGILCLIMDFRRKKRILEKNENGRLSDYEKYLKKYRFPVRNRYFLSNGKFKEVFC